MNIQNVTGEASSITCFEITITPNGKSLIYVLKITIIQSLSYW